MFMLHPQSDEHIFSIALHEHLADAHLDFDEHLHDVSTSTAAGYAGFVNRVYRLAMTDAFDSGC